MLLPNQLKTFLQEPRFYWLATRDAEFKTEPHRVFGLQIPGPDSLRFFLYQGTGEKSRANLMANKLVALSITNAFTFESYQFKGKMTEIRLITQEEEEFIANYISEMDRIVVAIGLPYPENSIVAQTDYKPSWAVEFQVEQIFDQTPKAGTGNLVATV